MEEHALLLAACRVDLESVIQQLEAGADVNMQWTANGTRFGQTALDLVLYNDENLGLLHSYKNTSKTTATPLGKAADEDRVLSIMQLLLARGAECQTNLFVRSCILGYGKVAEFVLARFHDAVDHIEGMTALQWVCYVPRTEDQTGLVRLLLDHNADPHTWSGFDGNALDMAISANGVHQPNMVRFLTSVMFPAPVAPEAPLPKSMCNWK